MEKLNRVVESSFRFYQLAEERSMKSAKSELSLGDFKLLFIAGHRAGRYLRLRRILEERGGQFRGQPRLKE